MKQSYEQTPTIIASSVFLVLILLLVASAIIWANKAQLDEVTRGSGRVIPSRQVQIIQNLEGGILSELLVREGDVVQQNEVLLKLDDTTFASTFRENQARRAALRAQLQRLHAEVNGSEALEFDGLRDKSAMAAERALFRARKTEYKSKIAVLERQAQQRRQEIVELKSRVVNIQNSLDLAKEEQEILKPMVAKGVTSRIELIRAERQTSELKQALEGAKLAIPRARSSLDEVIRRIEEHGASFVSQGRAELAQVRLRLAVIEQSIATASDRVRRTEVRSPVYGTVKRVMIKTLGGVVRPGMDLVEVVPLDDTLLIEARVRPSDVAFLRPGLAVKVRLTAYDFATYGSLEGNLEQISADALVDELGESFFLATVRTKQNYLLKGDAKLPIIPGMIAEIDILTGQRTVLEYFMEPINRVQEYAFREP